MNKNIGITVVIIALAVLASGVYMSMDTKDNVMMDKKMEDSAMVQKADEVLIVDDKVEGSVEVKNSDVDMKGSYEAYSVEKIARAEKGAVVLFFHASWCPSCRGLNSNIEANMSSIPERVSILKVDYDKETELKKKYSVTYQHTLVQVDKDGALIKKWSGSSKLSKLVSEIQ